MDDFNEAGGDVFDADDYVEDAEVQHWGASDEEEDVDVEPIQAEGEQVDVVDEYEGDLPVSYTHLTLPTTPYV